MTEDWVVRCAWNADWVGLTPHDGGTSPGRGSFGGFVVAFAVVAVAASFQHWVGSSSSFVQKAFSSFAFSVDPSSPFYPPFAPHWGAFSCPFVVAVGAQPSYEAPLGAHVACLAYLASCAFFAGVQGPSCGVRVAPGVHLAESSFVDQVAFLGEHPLAEGAYHPPWGDHLNCWGRCPWPCLSCFCSRFASWHGTSIPFCIFQRFFELR